MADLTQTAANVRCGNDASTKIVQAGESITAGMPVYKYSTDGKYYKADANDSTKVEVAGIALTNADADDYFVVQVDGDINLGATTTTGEIYILSSNAGKIAPASDIASGWYPVTIGKATDSSGNVTLNIDIGTVAHS